MATPHLIFTSKAKLGTIPVAKGNILAVIDTQEVYLDFNEATRKLISQGDPLGSGGIQDLLDKKAASSHTHAYITSIEISGTTLTYTTGDGQTKSYNTQDTNTTYGSVTTTANGLMTPELLTKLNGIAAGANNYTLPTAGINALGGVKTSSSVTNAAGYIPCPIIGGIVYYKDTNTTYTALKNPYALTLQLNGTVSATYDGSGAKTVNVTAAGIGAAAASHSHNYLPLSGGTITGNVAPNSDNTCALGLSNKRFNAVRAVTFYGNISGAAVASAYNVSALKNIRTVPASTALNTSNVADGEIVFTY